MELALTPAGRITLYQTADSPTAESDGQLGRLAKTFTASQGEGLFLLATERFAARCLPRLSTGGTLPPPT